MNFETYKNKDSSGVSSFSTGDDFIVVLFTDGEQYLYTYDSTGREHIDEMKRLANEGHGLATYINKNVRARFAKKLT
jgi:hypothetical protein